MPNRRSCLRAAAAALTALVLAAAASGCGKAPRPETDEAVEDPAAIVERPSPRAQRIALPPGTKTALVTLRDFGEIQTVRAVIEPRTSADLHTLRAAADGVLGRPPVGNARWPTTGAGVADCDALMVLVTPVAVSPAVTSAVSTALRRCLAKAPSLRTNAALFGPTALPVIAPCDGWVVAAPHPLGKTIQRDTELLRIACRGGLDVRPVADDMGKIVAERVQAAWLIDPSGAAPTHLAERPGKNLVWSVPRDHPLEVPGGSVSVALQTGAGRPTLAVESHALQRGVGRAFVQVVTADGRIEQRKVAIGESNDVLTEIIGGVVAGDRVVVAATE